MGLSDILSNIRALGADSDTILESIIASQGIQAARCDFDQASRQVVLSIKIRDQINYAAIPTGRVLTVLEICRLVKAGLSKAPQIAADPTTENSGCRVPGDASLDHPPPNGP